MTLRRFVWHPAIVLLALLFAAWESTLPATHATRADLVCATVLVTWLVAAGVAHRKENQS